MASALREYLAELRNLPAEVPIEPQLKHERQEQDKRLREEQDLAAGAVLTAVLQPGGSGSAPKAGDLVLVHYSIKSSDSGADAEVLFSTRSSEGGAGAPLAFMLEKGVRAPRAWEIALAAMTPGQRNALKCWRRYGFAHPDCGMAPPFDLPAPSTSTTAGSGGSGNGDLSSAKQEADSLAFEIEMVDVRTGFVAFGQGDCYKQTLTEGEGWEQPTAPCEVTFSCTVRMLAYDGVAHSGRRYFAAGSSSTATASDSTSTIGVRASNDCTDGGSVTAALGRGQLPAAVEACVSRMHRGERCLFIVPAAGMAAAGCFPAPPARAAQVELDIELHSIVQIRDVLGDGGVLKRRLVAGQGEFPIDCPLNDTLVTVHLRARNQGQEGNPEAVSAAWAYDSQTAGDGAPLVVDTGCGELPQGVELTVKLMVTGEIASALCQPRYAYAGRDDCPAGVSPEKPVLFEIQLLKFEKEANWHAMSLEERLASAEAARCRANSLYQRKRFAAAAARYGRLLNQLEGIRDIETAEQATAVAAAVTTVLLNLALAHHQNADYPGAVAACSKALEYDSASVKAYFRRGKAQLAFGEFDSAEADLRAAAALDASIQAEVNAALAQCRQRRAAAAAKQKREFGRFFG